MAEPKSIMLERGLARLRKRLGSHDGAYADIDGKEIIEADQWSGKRTERMGSVHAVPSYSALGPWRLSYATGGI